MPVNPSPIVALNRAIAIAQRDGPDRGLDAIKTISNLERLADYPFYPAVLGELELRRGSGGLGPRAFSKGADEGA
jgi:RNA polymerase sigma-70 factor (ECF subfamily)